MINITTRIRNLMEGEEGGRRWEIGKGAVGKDELCVMSSETDFRF